VSRTEDRLRDAFAGAFPDIEVPADTVDRVLRANGRRRVRFRIGAGSGALIVAAAIVVMCVAATRGSGPGDQRLDVIATPSATSSATTLVPADPGPPGSAGGCVPNAGPVIFIIEPDGPFGDGCAKVTADQAVLTIINKTSDFNQTGFPLVIRWANFPARVVPVGHSTTFTRPFGQYLEPGTHVFSYRGGQDGGLEIWLQ
jgi:hypothetical protein